MVRPLSPLLVRVALLDRGIRAYDPTALLSSQRRRLLFEGDSSAAPVPPPPPLLVLVLPLLLLLLPPVAPAPIATDFCPDEWTPPHSAAREGGWRPGETAT